MTTLPFTDWMGSTTTATHRGFRRSKDCSSEQEQGQLAEDREGATILYDDAPAVY